MTLTLIHKKYTYDLITLSKITDQCNIDFFLSSHSSYKLRFTTLRFLKEVNSHDPLSSSQEIYLRFNHFVYNHISM
ncbi:hypothetical protein EUGRSUZ_F04185 [Eucalyptus grandis]|uniref:Uncharacterized protein n=2 Tax=Eucalyptus grandis TaxID=71139 RepID=A0ACC3KNP0_EUCGR|nr:hypothetical protein EUGRSUZ_F04185 [Eucalyptus grandis]